MTTLANRVAVVTGASQGIGRAIALAFAARGAAVALAVASVALFLASDEAGGITGQAIGVDGGEVMA